MEPHVLAKTSTIEENGKFVVIVNGDDGNPRLSMVEGSGNARMDVGELVDTMGLEPKFARMYPGSGAAGSGSRSTGSAGKGGPDLDNMSPSEKMAYGRQQKRSA